MKKTIIVTGGLGYIGSHICKLLKISGYKVVVIDNGYQNKYNSVYPDEIIHQDIQNFEAIRMLLMLFRPDGIIHLAGHSSVAESVTNPQKYINNNVSGTLNILQSMVETSVSSIVLSSSASIYGNPFEQITEKLFPKPINPYGLSKLLMEHLALSYSLQGIKSVSLRYFNAAGADIHGELGELHNPETHLIPLAIKAVMNNEPITVFGDNYPTYDGSCIRDYIHVDDLAVAHTSALEYLFNDGKSEVLNLGTGTGSSVFDVINAVETITGSKVKIQIAPRRQGDPAELVANNDKAYKILNWKPKYDLNDMVSHAWNFFRSL